MMTWLWNVNSATKGPTSKSFIILFWFLLGVFWEAHRERDTHPVCCYMPVFTCNSQPVDEREWELYMLTCSEEHVWPPANLCGVSAVVSPYLLLPLVSRLVTWRTAEWNTATSHAADGQMSAFIRSEGSEKLNFMRILNLHWRQTPFSSPSADLDF